MIEMLIYVKLHLWPVAAHYPGMESWLIMENWGKPVDCDEFVRMDIRYQHTFAHRSPNRDYIPMYLDLQDKEANVLKQEFFQIVVLIKEGEKTQLLNRVLWQWWWWKLTSL